ncbi:hypothetical protein E2C01_040372 [Portunus trituberculatus]|uniref:Uncharacterized protein n=1 Tax=Portunus trituberculatus TaxID=210409 RepID=A0A5B7FN55_PORTR|nr:hypothetical protein [Portunus trituberculatus]
MLSVPKKMKKGRERMTTSRLTPTTEDRPLYLIDSGRRLSDQTGHKSSSLPRKASLLEETQESFHV